MADEKAGQQAEAGPKAEASTPVPTVQHNGETLEVWGDAPEKMRKGIQLHVTLYVEGDDAPAHSFGKSAEEAVRDIIKAGGAKHPELTVTIKKIAEK
ncbi:MAG TPA: hypothetical protein VJZ91_07485 [Blastocatellia bacterium]|nr:hypothetical protein [Blastocatellia bacterium]